MKTLVKNKSCTARNISLLQDVRGLSTVEYVIILVLIAAAAIGAWVTLGGSIKAKLDDANAEMDKVQVEGSEGNRTR